MHSTDTTSIVKSVAYCDGCRVADVKICDVREVLKQPDHFVWIGLHEPSEEVLGEVHLFSHEPSRETTAQIYQLKRELLEVKRAISPLIDICNRLVRFDFDLIPEDTRTYFRDIYDHAIRINEIVDNTRELLSTALEANFSLLSISQSEVGKRFAGWAAIFGVPTLIAGLYGMKFHHMPGMDWDYAFELVLILTICTCLALYIFFRRAG